MYVIKINLAPARFELGTFCLEQLGYIIFIYIYIYIINKLLKKKITITIITIRNDEKNLRWKYIFKYIYINVYMIIL